MKPVIIYGAGGHARVILDAARAAGLDIAFFVDDHPPGSTVGGLRVLVASAAFDSLQGGFGFIVAIGNNSVRAGIFRELQQRGGVPITVIHPFSWISPSTQIGAGTVVFGGVVINADVSVGENCILNTTCSIDHDCKIGAHSHICPGTKLAGNVSVGERTTVGIGSACIPGVSIGSDAIVGAGSVVVRPIPDKCVAFGGPAVKRRTLP